MKSGRSRVLAVMVVAPVTGVRVNKNGNLRSVLGTRSKWAVATIAWDVEFLAWGAESHHGLNPSLYANEHTEREVCCCHGVYS